MDGGIERWLRMMKLVPVMGWHLVIGSFLIHHES